MLNKLIKALHSLEDSILLSLVIFMIVMSCSPIILRNLHVGGATWVDTAIRISVLWLAIFGAMRASREQSHIAIDLVSHYAPKNMQLLIHTIVSLCCAVICAIATYYSVHFVYEERAEGLTAFLSVPNWACEAILPFGLAIITFRFLSHAFTLPVPHEQTL